MHNAPLANVEKVAVTSRSESELPDGVLDVKADGTDEASVDAACAQVEAAHGPGEVLVANAGITKDTLLMRMSEDDFTSVIDTNLTAVWTVARTVGRHFVAQGSGSIVNIGSMSGMVVNRPQWQPAYNASKAAVHHLTRSLAAEWGPSGVRVNALAPGYIKTDMSPVDDPYTSPGPSRSDGLTLTTSRPSRL